MSELDIRLVVGTEDHPKIEKLCRTLGAEAYRCLTRLWGYARQHHPSTGVLSGMAADDVEIAARWPGERAGQFVAALCKLRLLDNVRGTFALHDWADHQPYAIDTERRKRAATVAGQASAEARRERLLAEINGSLPNTQRPVEETPTTRSTESDKPFNGNEQTVQPLPSYLPSYLPSNMTALRAAFSWRDSTRKFNRGWPSNEQFTKLIDRWADTFDKLNRIDGWSWRDIRRIMDALSAGTLDNDGFSWMGNAVRSPAKLRKTTADGMPRMEDLFNRLAEKEAPKRRSRVLDESFEKYCSWDLGFIREQSDRGIITSREANKRRSALKRKYDRIKEVEVGK